MRFYRKKIFHGIQFDKAGYCQFLKEQGLTEQQVKMLAIHLTEMELDEDIPTDKIELGSFREAKTFLKPVAGKSSIGPRIFLHPEQHNKKYSLNDTLLEETRHYIQWCTGAWNPDERIEYAARPEEIDAKEFAIRHKDMHFLKGLS